MGSSNKLWINPAAKAAKADADPDLASQNAKLKAQLGMLQAWFYGKSDDAVDLEQWLDVGSSLFDQITSSDAAVQEVSNG